MSRLNSALGVTPNGEDGSLLRELTIDPNRDYQSLQSSAMT